MQITKNISLKELTQSQTALRNNLSNEPASHHIVNLAELCENVLQPLRDYYEAPIKITSGYRSEELASLIGSKATSQHCQGEAADFEIPGVDNKELGKWIRDNLEVDQGILEFYKDGEPTSGWIHCSYSRNNNRQQWLRANRIDGKTQYIPWLGE